MSAENLKAAIESSDNPKAASDIINWALAHKAQIGELIAAINAITTGTTMSAKAVGLCEIITLVAADIDELGPIVTHPVVDPPQPPPSGDDVFGAKLEGHDPVALGGLITILPLLIKLWPLIQQIIALIQSAKG